MVRSTRSTHPARRPTTRSMAPQVTRKVSRAGRRPQTRSDPAGADQLCKDDTTTVESGEGPRVSRRRRTSGRLATKDSDTSVCRKVRNTNARGKSVSAKGRATRTRCSTTPAVRSALEKQLESVIRENKELTHLVDEYKTTASQHLLRNLEENFSCPLCFEIMASPYTLRSPSCGHTFCATCILKWFFSRLHRSCGDWHDMVQCPICRCALSTPDYQPRSEHTFPFIPNRTLDGALQGLMKSLAGDLDDQCSSSSASSALSAWSEKGPAKQDWANRDKAGRNEMTSLGSQWTTMKAVDFVNFKNRLDV
ncbi:hypothetical protein EV401DRAFT_1932568 [Pisolithus croceorrhizus]|nr:hypothetical protein EV401DRAFT_1932568 [Pisolithus croceorrhizus]